jgi:hypothetical protein
MATTYKDKILAHALAGEYKRVLWASQCSEQTLSGMCGNDRLLTATDKCDIIIETVKTLVGQLDKIQINGSMASDILWGDLVLLRLSNEIYDTIQGLVSRYLPANF